MAATRYLVIGGGAGGIELAIRLAKRGIGAVTLVDERPAHLWKPRLHEIAAGLLVAADEAANYAAQAARHGFAFVLGRVERIDPAARTVAVAAVDWPAGHKPAGPPMLPARSLDYDVAVLAVGSTIDDFGTPGVGERAYALDTPEGAEQLHRAFLAGAARLRAGLDERLRIVIAGAGTTGVELAAELRHSAVGLADCGMLPDAAAVEIAIVDMADRPLPHVPADMSDYARRMLESHDVACHLGRKVTAIDGDGVHLDGGATLPADIAIWSTGIKARGLAGTIAGADTSRSGQLCVCDRLRVAGPGIAPGSLYAIGDCASAPSDDGRVPATAQAAHQQARYLAEAIDAADPPPFRYRYRGTLVSLGTKAAGDLPGPRDRGIQIRGIGARVAYALLYRSHLAMLFGWWRTATMTASDRLRRTAAPAVKLHWG